MKIKKIQNIKKRIISKAYFKFKSNGQNNQGRDYKIVENEISKDTEGVKRELTNKDNDIKLLKGENHLLKEELKKTKENYNDLNQLRQKLEEELNKEIKSLKKQLEQEFDVKLKTLKDYNALKKQNDELTLEKEELRKRNNELTLEKEELMKRNSEMKEHQEKIIDNLEQQLKDQMRNSMQEFQQAQEKYKEEINDIRQKLDEKRNSLHELEEKNAKLREETLDDNKLKTDILKVQNMLEDYVTNLKPNVNLDIKKIQNLAQTYDSLNEINAEKPNKHFIKAILQRKVLEVVFEFYNKKLFKYRGENVALELDIEFKAKELLKLIKTFSTTRVGTDDVINTAAIKIRQQVYKILDNRGFNNIIPFDGNTSTHHLIANASNELNKIMNQYRKINDIDRKEKVEAMAPRLVQDICKLFFFRVNVQEPKTENRFYENVKINPNTMKGVWNNDEIDRLCVDICYFPLFGQNLDSLNKKIYTPAKVFPRNINGQRRVLKT